MVEHLGQHLRWESHKFYFLLAAPVTNRFLSEDVTHISHRDINILARFAISHYSQFSFHLLLPPNIWAIPNFHLLLYGPHCNLLGGHGLPFSIFFLCYYLPYYIILCYHKLLNFTWNNAFSLLIGVSKFSITNIDHSVRGTSLCTFL